MDWTIRQILPLDLDPGQLDPWFEPPYSRQNALEIMRIDSATITVSKKRKVSTSNSQPSARQNFGERQCQPRYSF
jgi:hypothetical protein